MLMAQRNHSKFSQLCVLTISPCVKTIHCPHKNSMVYLANLEVKALKKWLQVLLRSMDWMPFAWSQFFFSYPNKLTLNPILSNPNLKKTVPRYYGPQNLLNLPKILHGRHVTKMGLTRCVSTWILILHFSEIFTSASWIVDGMRRHGRFEVFC